MPKRKTSEAEVSPVPETPIKRAESKKSTTLTVHKHASTKSTTKPKVVAEALAEPIQGTLVAAATPVITEEQIAIRAYLLWEARGGQNGSAVDDWFSAERELKAELNA